MTLAKETKARGWWHAYGDVIPAWFNVFVGLEEAPLPVRAPRLSGDLAIVGVSNGSQVRLALARTGGATSSPADSILLRKPQGRKSRRSADQGNCVEVAFLDDGNVAVRDSEDRGAGAALVFTPVEWTAFVVGGVVGGEFERP